MPCYRPFNKNGIPCPCGKCDHCRKRHASGWSFRILQEAARLGAAFFVTLTYDNEHNPMKYEFDPEPIRQTWQPPIGMRKKKRRGKDMRYYKPTQMPTVDIRHLQRFIKRVRKQNASKEIKYYAVSEYGAESKRPHYHIIFLGLDIITFVGEKNWHLYQQGLIRFDGQTQFNIDTWKKGHITVGKCTPASVAYTLKYISKGRIVPQYKGDKRQPEKSIMSKGIGQAYITPVTKKLHNQDLMRQYVVTQDSKKIPIPRYLKNQLYDDLERQFMVQLYAQKYMNDVSELGEIELQKHYMQKRRNVDKIDLEKFKIKKSGKI